MDKKIIETDNLITISQLCMTAYKESNMIGITGYPGAGKTTCFEWFTNEYKDKIDVYLVTVGASMNASKFFSSIIYQITGEEVTSKLNLNSLINKIAFLLNHDGMKKLLIVDEAGKFKKKMLEYMHELRDKTMNSTGIILAGPKYFKMNIDEWSEKNVNGIPEVQRRFNFWVSLEKKPRKQEIRAIIKSYRINDDSFINSVVSKARHFGDVENAIKKYFIDEEDNKNDEK